MNIEVNPTLLDNLQQLGISTEDIEEVVNVLALSTLHQQVEEASTLGALALLTDNLPKKYFPSITQHILSEYVEHLKHMMPIYTEIINSRSALKVDDSWHIFKERLCPDGLLALMEKSNALSRKEEL